MTEALLPDTLFRCPGRVPAGSRPALTPFRYVEYFGLEGKGNLSSATPVLNPALHLQWVAGRDNNVGSSQLARVLESECAGSGLLQSARCPLGSTGHLGGGVIVVDETARTCDESWPCPSLCCL
jgi:hypothetical protein